MEIWKPIPGSNYEASSLGRIRNPTGKVLKPQPHPVGYQTVSVRLDGRMICKTVHSLVALAFHGPRPEGLDVAHGNCVKTDNRPSNLRYATRSDNMLDSLMLGTVFNRRAYPFRSLEIGESFEANPVGLHSIRSTVRQARIRTGRGFTFAANDNGSWTVTRVA